MDPGGAGRRRGPGLGAYVRYRRGIGRAILLGLELLVAADIIRTVAIDPTFESLGVLAVIVAIRTSSASASSSSWRAAGRGSGRWARSSNSCRRRVVPLDRRPGTSPA